MPLDLIKTVLEGPFQINSRPEPVPGDLRRGWGIAVLILILGRSYNKRASLQKLHFMAYSIRSQHNRNIVQEVLLSENKSLSVIVRIEPWLNNALAFAHGSGLVKIEKGKAARLTIKGTLVLVEITRDELVFSDEIAFLNSVSKLATEDTINRIMKPKLDLWH
jgi:hypothetical protein